MNKLDRIIEAIQELKISSVRHNEILERLTASVEYHIKRTDTLEDLHAILKEELIAVKIEHKLTKQLLEAAIAVEKAKQNEKTNLLTNTLKTIFTTLGIVGTLLLALHELGVFKKFFE